MKYEIFGGSMPAVTITLDNGEKIYTESGGMTWRTDGLVMTVDSKINNAGFGSAKQFGSTLLKSVGRIASGESLFMDNYISQRDNSQITIASSVPGEIKVFDVSPQKSYIAQKGSFLCAQPEVELSTVVNNDVAGAIFGGEGFVMQKFTGNGLLFCELDGSIKEYELADGESIIVNTGNVAIFESTVNYSIEKTGGAKNSLLGGEGFFSTRLTGPGKVWLQTMTLARLARKLSPFISK